MNKAGRLALTMLILILAGGLLTAQQPTAAPTATTPTASGPSKIMFINFSVVLSGTEESKREFGLVESYVEEQNRENETRTQDLQNRQQQLAEQQRALNPQTLAEMQREIAKASGRLLKMPCESVLTVIVVGAGSEAVSRGHCVRNRDPTQPGLQQCGSEASDGPERSSDAKRIHCDPVHGLASSKWPGGIFRSSQ